ncbi:hypothetical protein SuNHUV7_05390 (plasmid) [Pseudoseohaeicola sp. NH-UV-7]|uniref:hypothetical protein n=1 Tax=Sulfitobacter sp. TBRI5 TaxID=2989732 RepID=UPI003A603322
MTGQYGQTVHAQVLPPHGVTDAELERRLAVAGVATAPIQNEELNLPSTAVDQDTCKHGFALNGHPKTWTGKIVSLEEWQRLSVWEKHGPDGRRWSGKTKKWEAPE